MERIGIYGGSFNPPHLGHIRAAQCAVSALDLDAMLLIPCHISPGKQEAAVSGFDRMDMLRLAAGDDPKLQICQLELARGGTSYTCDTVEKLRLQYPEAELYLCVGSDAFCAFSGWKNPEKILQQVTLVVMHRGGKQERQQIREAKAALEKMGARIICLDNAVTDISSTQLRRMLVFGCAKPFLSGKVLEFIREKGLYGTAESYKNLPMEQLEQVVISLLKPCRVNHVLGCRDTAVELARCWGADETDAARAGILHDITKALDGPVQLTLCSEYGIILDEFSENNPKTLHALTGSLVAQRIFGENPQVVEAVRWHTTGKADMTLLQKIIYVADYMEPNRDFEGVEQLRHLAFTDLDAALKLGLEMTLAMLREQGREISPGSQAAIDWLNSK